MVSPTRTYWPGRYRFFLGLWGARKVRERIIGRLPRIDSVQAQELASFSTAIFKGMRPRTEALPTFSDEQLTNLEMPVLVLLGENDITMDSQAIRRRIKENVMNPTVRVVPRMRHFLGNQSESIRNFLAQNHSSP